MLDNPDLVIEAIATVDACALILASRERTLFELDKVSRVCVSGGGGFGKATWICGGGVVVIADVEEEAVKRSVWESAILSMTVGAFDDMKIDSSISAVALEMSFVVGAAIAMTTGVDSSTD